MTLMRDPQGSVSEMIGSEKTIAIKKESDSGKELELDSTDDDFK